MWPMVLCRVLPKQTGLSHGATDISLRDCDGNIDNIIVNNILSKRTRCHLPVGR